MRRTASLIMIVGLTAASMPAVAQTPGPNLNRPIPRYDTNLAQGGTSTDFHNRLINEVIEGQRETYGRATSREALIDRLAPLVAEGRCGEARHIARQEGDRAVSRRIGEVCVEGRVTPMPAASAR
ncbi:hypothetical protein [Brevundimonas sp.]|uniref:hypothetical protein n=1 Tax=Brevundimonas sp. TaxID=1871086 RepID=UPI002FDB135C